MVTSLVVVTVSHKLDFVTRGCSNAAAALGNSPSPERPYMEARMREMVAPIIAVTMVDFEDGDSAGGGDGTRRSSRGSKKTSVEGQPGLMLQVGATEL